MFMFNSSPTLHSNHHHPRPRKLCDTSPYRPFFKQTTPRYTQVSLASMLFEYILYSAAVTLFFNALNTLNKDSGVHRLWKFKFSSLDVSQVFTTLKSFIVSSETLSSGPVFLDISPPSSMNSARPLPALGFCEPIARCLHTNGLECDLSVPGTSNSFVDICPSLDIYNMTFTSTMPEQSSTSTLALSPGSGSFDPGFEVIFLISLILGFLTLVSLVLWASAGRDGQRWDIVEVRHTSHA